MNIYLIIAIILVCILLFLLIKDFINYATDYDNLLELYDELDDDGKEYMDRLIDKMLEASKKREQRRRKLIGKIFDSNQWLWVLVMQISYRWFLNKEEREEWKQGMINKYPHLRDAIEEIDNNDNSNPTPKT